MPARVFTDTRRNKAMALDPRAVGESYDEAETETESSGAKAIAIINIDGPLEHHAGWWFDSYDAILERFTCAIECDDVKAVALRIDSPGGDVSGLFETVRSMRALSTQHGKPVYAFADESAYSAAYALAMAADELYLPATGGVGSVGVIAAVHDRSEANKKAGLNVAVLKSGARKADGHPDVPLEAPAIKRMQKRVDQLAGFFFECVADARGLDAQTIRAWEAGCFYGSDAVKNGLADGVMSWSEMLAAIAASLEGADFAGVKTARTSGGPDMSKKLAAQKALSDAKAKLLKAKTAAQKKTANALIAKCTKALATIDAKYKKTRKVEETESSDEDADDDDAEETEADDDAEDAEDSEDADEDADEEDDDEKDDDDDDDEDEDDAEAEDDAEDGKKAAASLIKLARAITGKKNISHVRGALAALAENNKRNAKLASQVKAMKASSRKQRVDTMIADAVKAGKIEPAQKEIMRAQGMKDPGYLKAFIAASSGRVLRELRPGPATSGAHGLDASDIEIATKQGVPLDRFAKAKATVRGGRIEMPIPTIIPFDEVN